MEIPDENKESYQFYKMSTFILVIYFQFNFVIANFSDLWNSNNKIYTLNSSIEVKPTKIK